MVSKVAIWRGQMKVGLTTGKRVLTSLFTGGVAEDAVLAGTDVIFSVSSG